MTAWRLDMTENSNPYLRSELCKTVEGTVSCCVVLDHTVATIYNSKLCSVRRKQHFACREYSSVCLPGSYREYLSVCPCEKREQLTSKSLILIPPNWLDNVAAWIQFCSFVTKNLGIPRQDDSEVAVWPGLRWSVMLLIRPHPDGSTEVESSAQGISLPALPGTGVATSQVVWSARTPFNPFWRIQSPMN